YGSPAWDDRLSHDWSLCGGEARIERIRRRVRSHSERGGASRRDLEGELVTHSLGIDRKADRRQVIGADAGEGEHRTQQDGLAEVVRRPERTIPFRAEPIAETRVQRGGL